jgi:hypothetical protein
LLEYAWYDKNSGGRTHAVGEKKPNGFGLYDTHGNVREWNQEMLMNARVHRGGNCFNPDGFCAVSNRRTNPPAARIPNIGVRVARAAGNNESIGVTTPPPIAPLAKEIDLLKLIDLKRDVVAGAWTFQGSKLVVVAPDGEKPHRLLIPYEPPPEYQIDMVVERKNEKSGQLNIGLVVGGKQTMVCVDGFGTPQVSGLETVDGKQGHANETTRKGRLLPLDRPTSIGVRVRNKEITLICEQKTIFQWKGEPARLGFHSYWSIPNPRVLFLGSQAGIEIHKMTLSPLGEPLAGEAGFVPLFNGKDLTGWEIVGDGKAFGVKAPESVLVAGPSNPSSYLQTSADYGDFHLRFEFKAMTKNANSGINVRVVPGAKGLLQLQVQIRDDSTPYAGANTGSVYWSTDEQQFKREREDLCRPFGEWNTMEIIARGTRITVLINDKKSVDADLSAVAQDPRALPSVKRSSGRVAIEAYKGEVWYRNIEIKELPTAKAQNGPDDDAFVPLFNGKDLTGWRTTPPPPGTWGVDNGVLVGRGVPQRGHLSTQRAFLNFHLRVETMLSQGQHGHVEIRGVNLQEKGWWNYNMILGGTNPKGRTTGDLQAGLKVLRQASGVPPLKPGEWFTLEMIADGNHFNVLVNGKRVVDYVDEQHKYAAAPLTLTCNPNAMVKFRKLEVKELPPTKSGT